MQSAGGTIGGAFYEADFVPVSDGYRSGVGAKDAAVSDRGLNLQYGRMG